MSRAQKIGKRAFRAAAKAPSSFEGRLLGDIETLLHFVEAQKWAHAREALERLARELPRDSSDEATRRQRWIEHQRKHWPKGGLRVLEGGKG